MNPQNPKNKLSKPIVVTAVTRNSAGHTEFDNCRTIPIIGANGVTAPIGLRLYALVQPITNGKYFPAEPLPYQGYKISVEGTLGNSDEISRDVTVYKSFPFATGVLDFALYAKNSLTP